MEIQDILLECVLRTRTDLIAAAEEGGGASTAGVEAAVEVTVIAVEDGGTVEDEASEVGGGEGDVAEGGYSCERV